MREGGRVDHWLQWFSGQYESGGNPRRDEVILRYGMKRGKTKDQSRGRGVTGQYALDNIS